MKIFHVNYFVIEILEKMQLIFDRDRRSTCENPVQCLIWWTSTEVMHGARQTFCLDLFSMFHKTRSCLTLYFCLVMQNTSYEGFTCWFMRWNFRKKSAHYTQRVNRFMCNILYMIHYSNLVLRSEGWVCIFSGGYMWHSLWPIWHQNKTTYMISSANIDCVT